MIDTQVMHLLRQVVDTTTKLHIMRVFYEQRALHATPSQMAEQASRDIWSVSEALRELHEDGILKQTNDSAEPIYSYAPPPDYIKPIRELMRTYDDPQVRNHIHRSLRDLSGFATVRRAAGRQAAS